MTIVVIIIDTSKECSSSSAPSSASALTEEDVSKISACLKLPKSWRAMVRLAAETGLRWSELVNLRLHDIHLETVSPHIRVHGPHTTQPRIVRLYGMALGCMRMWLEELPRFAPQNPEGLAFPNEYGRRRLQMPLGEMLEACGINKDARWADLRKLWRQRNKAARVG